MSRPLVARDHAGGLRPVRHHLLLGKKASALPGAAGSARRESQLVDPLKELIVLNEGFLTYGGMSVREIEAIAVGLEETMDLSIISQGPEFIAYMVAELEKRGVPVVTPAGGLGCHLDASRFVSHIPPEQYPAAALGAALYIAGSIRGMERGTLSESRDAEGNETIAKMELLRLRQSRAASSP